MVGNFGDRTPVSGSGVFPGGSRPRRAPVTHDPRPWPAPVKPNRNLQKLKFDKIDKMYNLSTPLFALENAPIHLIPFCLLTLMVLLGVGIELFAEVSAADPLQLSKDPPLLLRLEAITLWKDETRLSEAKFLNQDTDRSFDRQEREQQALGP